MGCGQTQNKKLRNDTKLTTTEGQDTKTPGTPAGIMVTFLPPYENVQGLVLSPTDKLDKALVAVIAKLPHTRTKRTLLCGGKILTDEDGQKLLKDIIPKNVTELSIEVKCTGVEVTANAEEEYGKIRYLAKPIRDGDELDLIIFDKTNLTISVDSITEKAKQVENGSLSDFNELSAYCNGMNNLYISGGEKAKEATADFCTINLETKAITKHPTGMVHPRKWHSMIYVPYNYVFMVGGTASKKVEYFDIERNSFVDHSELNIARSESTLALVDNTYLYAFSGLDEKRHYVKSFERISLIESRKQWEVLEFKLTEGVTIMAQALFGIGYHTEKEMLFLGGVDNVKNDSSSSENNYIFNFVDNTIKKSDVPRVKEEFSSKTFLPVFPGLSFALPDMYKDSLKICRYGNKGGYGVIHFEPELENNFHLMPENGKEYTPTYQTVQN